MKVSAESGTFFYFFPVSQELMWSLDWKLELSGRSVRGGGGDSGFPNTKQVVLSSAVVGARGRKVCVGVNTEQAGFWERGPRLPGLPLETRVNR